MAENLGGAGGFATGIKLAVHEGADWIWLMDDDAMPAQDALEKLLQPPLDESCVYGSIAVGDNSDHLCWPVETDTGKKLNTLDDLYAPRIPVSFHPFLGFFINRQLVEKAGLPDSSFFLSGDDVEYCLRCGHHGGKVFLCRDSKLKHPMPPRKSISIFELRINLLVQPPQRAYYNTRNKIVIARRYYGNRLWTQTMPGIFIRLLLSSIFGPNRLGQLKAYFIAIFHGFADKMGKFTV